MKSWAAAPATVIRHPAWSSQHNRVTFDFLTPASPPPPGRRSEGDGGLSSWCCACGSSGTCLQRERENMLRHHQEAVTEEHTGTWSLKAGMCLCAESGHAIVSGTFPKFILGFWKFLLESSPLTFLPWLWHSLWNCESPHGGMLDLFWA